MSDRIGQQIGNYQLLRLLGEGGFSEVYLGEHIHLGTQAAVKVLQTKLARSDIEQFRNEARTIGHLEHPYIVRVFDFGIEGKTPFLVMSYAPGGTLRTRHPKGTRLPTDLVVSYASQVASALQYAHDHKVIHRDIKPENLLVGSSDEILLSDFGIALIAQSSRYQNTTDIVGTISYMAPEQIAGHPRTASDQYALGIVIYEWLCGTRPFHGSLTEIAAQHSVTPPPSPLQHLPTLSPEIEQVIMMALSKRPEDRFASVSAFALALEQADQSSFPTERAPLPSFSSPWPPSDSFEVPSLERVKEPIRSLERKRGVPQRWVLSGLTGLVIVALVGGLIWSIFLHYAPATVPATPTTSVVHVTPTTSVVPPPLVRNITEFPLPRSGSSPAQITVGRDNNLWFTEVSNRIGRITTDGRITEFPLPVSGSQPGGITVGPDGNLWFTEETGNKIGRMSMDGAITEFPLPTFRSGPCGITAGPDGNLWFTEAIGNIGRISTDGTITEFSLPIAGTYPCDITVGPDGNLWFSEAYSNKIGRISTSGTVTEFPLSSGSGGITAGRDGHLWFTEPAADQIGSISTDGTITEFPLPTSGSYPGQIVARPDGNLWFSEFVGNKIGCISINGTVTEFPLSTSGSHPSGIVVGPDGNLWFTENVGNNIGRVTLGK